MLTPFHWPAAFHLHQCSVLCTDCGQRGLWSARPTSLAAHQIQHEQVFCRNAMKDRTALWGKIKTIARDTTNRQEASEAVANELLRKNHRIIIKNGI
jgi:hypothetical protein